MYQIKRSQRFKKDFKRVAKRSVFDEKVFMAVIDHLATGAPLPRQYKEHALRGEFVGCMECHLSFDLLLIYTVDHEERMLYLFRIGAHSELF